MPNNLCYIKPKNSLKKRDKCQKIIDAIKIKISSLSDVQSLRSNNIIDPELILMVCNCIENSFKKGAGVDKKSLVVEILNGVFSNLNQQEINHVTTQCQYNYDNELIKTIPILYKTGSILFNYIKSKL